MMMTIKEKRKAAGGVGGQRVHAGRPHLSNIEAKSQEKAGSQKCRYLGKERVFPGGGTGSCNDSGASVCVAL